MLRRLLFLFPLMGLALTVASVPAAEPAFPGTAPPAVKADAGPVSPAAIEGDPTASFLAYCKVTNLAAGDVLFWDVSPDAGIESRESEAERSIAFAGPAGTYRVKARGTQGGAKFTLTKTITLTGGANPQPGPGPGPNPNPGPQPGPQPQPGPDGAAVSTFVVVEDTLKAGPWRGEILGSPAVEAFYRQLRGTRTGLIHTLLDVNEPDAVPEFKKYVTAAAGKQLPYLFLLDSQGKTVKECPADVSSPAAFLAAFDTHDGPRAMGLIMEAPKLKWVEFGTTPNTPIIPRAQWPKARKLAAYLPPVYDQDGVGQCASSACCTAMELAAYSRGYQYPKLAAGDLYGRREVNGGRDRGSLLEDNLAEAMKGVAPASMVPYVWDGKLTRSAEVIAARKKYRVVEAYWCPTFDAMVSASLQGFSVGTGLMWFNNFKPDKDGWLPKRGVGQAGGHALCVYGMEQRADGTVGVWVRNSWNTSWGFAGDCCIPESLFDGQIGGYYAIRVVTSPTVVVRTKFDDVRESLFSLAW